MIQTDTGLYDILSQKVYAFPTTTPSGFYTGPMKHTRYENKYPDNEKISVSLQVTGRQSSSVSTTLTGVPAEQISVTGAISGAVSSTGLYPWLDNTLQALKKRRCCDDHDYQNIKLEPYTGEL